MQRVAARILLILGGLAAAVSWWSFAAQRTVFDPQVTHDVATHLLDAGPLQDAAASSLASQLRTALPRGTDPALVAKVARDALRDERVHEAFGDAVRTLHEQLLARHGSHHELVVDTATMTTALRAALTAADPDLARRVTPTNIDMRFDTRHLPNLAAVDEAAPSAQWLGFAAAIVLWTLALLVHPDHLTAGRLVARRIACIGAVPVIMWVLVPTVLRAVSGDAARGLAPVVSGYGGRLVPAATALLVLGVGAWLVLRIAPVLAHYLARRRGEQVTPGVVVPLPRRARRTPHHPAHGVAVAAGNEGIDLLL